MTITVSFCNFLTISNLDNDSFVMLSSSISYILTIDTLFLSVNCRGHSYIIIFDWISSKFQSLNTGISRQTINKMADKTAATYYFALVDALPWSLITRLLPNFKYGLLLLLNSCPNCNMG